MEMWMNEWDPAWERRKLATVWQLQESIQRQLAGLLVGRVTLMQLTRRRLMASTSLKPNGQEI